jgi:tetratricopeptide (TPR) repeat protein
MTDFTSVEIPKPKDWQAFERHCRLLFEYSLHDAAVQNNGRSGQRQHGVDIFGKRGGGIGPQVGVQCKGKSADYGGAVTDKELAAELEKTKKFRPELEEFIIVTTAPDDAKIQQAARLIEKKVRGEGRNLSIQVWGWGRVQDEVNRFPEVIRAFHPDKQPFSDQIRGEVRETNRLVAEGNASSALGIAEIKQTLAQMMVTQRPPLSTEATGASDAFDKELHNQIDAYRDLLRGGQSRTALTLLNRLKARLGETAPKRVRYRLLSNIGAAHYNLGEYDAASDFLLEAAPLDPDDPISLANKTAALLIKGRREEAHATVAEAMFAHPDSQELALQRVQALGPAETSEDVWQTLSPTAKNTPAIFGFRVAALRDERNGTWIAVAAEGRLLYADDEGLKILQAESVLDRLLHADPGAVGLLNGEAPTNGEIEQAALTLEKCWTDSKKSEGPPKLACAHNAALAWNILRKADRAAPLLDEAIAAGYDSDETKHLRLSIYRKQGKISEAIRLSDTLSDTPTHRVMRADLRIETAPAEAREILSGRGAFTYWNDIIAAGLVVAETYISEKDFDEALREADRLEQVLPRHPQGPLAHFRVKMARGDKDATDDVRRAFTLVDAETDFPTRFLVAEGLATAGRFDDVVSLLADTTDRHYDSPALRALIAAAVNTDKRVLLRQILRELTPELATDRYYTKAQIALSIRTGNIRKAEQEIRAFLEREPDNLELYIQLLHALFRQNKIEDLKAEVQKPASGFKGQPSDFMTLAHFKDDFGDWREAHKLAYATLLANPNSQSVAMGYVGVFLRPGHSQELTIHPPAVEPDMTVGIKTEDGGIVVYVIEPETSLRPGVHYLPPDHLLATRLLGKEPGDRIELPDGTAAEVAWIKPKVLHALHDVMENFNNWHPEATGLERIKVEPGKEGGLEPMLERLRDRHDAVEQVGALYDAGALPIAIVGKNLGCDAVEAMVGLADTGHRIRSCDGNHLERNTALATINANAAKGCVVDYLTLHVIRRLKLEAVVSAVCGPMKIVDATRLTLQRKIFELGERIDESDMSISWRDGQYWRQETSPEQKREHIKLLEADHAWLDANTQIIPAEGNKDPSPEFAPLIDRFGSGFFDEIRAAEGAGLLLLSEDFLLRMLAMHEFRVQGTWLQPILMSALDRQMMTLDEYRAAILSFIDSKFEFISVGTPLVVSSVHGTRGHALPKEFETIASRLGGEKADIASHVRVAYESATQIWGDESLSETVRQGAVGRLLERVIDERSPLEARLVLESWLNTESERPGGMHRYMTGWLRGHFIKM